MHRLSVKSIMYGSLTGGLITFASSAYAWYRPMFPLPLYQPLDWIAFPLCPFLYLAYVPTPHLIRFLTPARFLAIITIMNAALYALVFVIFTALLRRIQQKRNNIEAPNEI